MQTHVKATETTPTTTPFQPEYSFINKEGQLCTYPASTPEVKINQSIIVRDGLKHHNCKVISFSNKTNLIEIKINKKPAMCFRYWKDGLFFLVKKVPTK